MLRVPTRGPTGRVRTSPCSTGRAQRRGRRGLLHVRQVAQTPPSSAQREDSPGQGDATAGMEEAAGRCPVLRALARPSQTHVPWWFGPLVGFTNPRLLQDELAKTAPVVLYKGIGPSFTYVLDGALARIVFSAEAEGKEVVPRFGPVGESLLGKESLFNVERETHAKLRRLMMPTFSFDEVMRYVPRIRDVAQSWQDSWAASAKPVPAEDAFRGFTFEIITNVVFGLEMSREANAEMGNDFKELVLALADPLKLKHVPFTPYARGLRARERILTRLQAQIDDVRGKHKHGTSAADARSMLEKLVAARDDDGSRLTDQQILDNMLLLLFAGHDTTSHALALLMMHLGSNRHVLQQLQEEQGVVSTQHGDALTPSALRAMRFLDATIAENLRMNSIVASLPRTVKEPIELGEYSLQAGDTLMVGMDWVMRNDPRWAGASGNLAPDVFNPNRFLQPGGRETGWQMPFGHGPHVCIGQQLAQVEMKVMLATLLRRWDLDIEVRDERLQWSPLSSPRDVRVALTSSTQQLRYEV